MHELLKFLESEIDKLHAAHTYKVEVPLEGPQDHHVRVGGHDVVMLTSNNYLGLANHPRVRAAAIAAVEKWGAGMGSVRFICGTQLLHKELEAAIARFYETDDAILYASCWNANEACFATITGSEDAMVSDELNHASIIDGIRLAKAKRYIYSTTTWPISKQSSTRPVGRGRATSWPSPTESSPWKASWHRCRRSSKRANGTARFWSSTTRTPPG